MSGALVLAFSPWAAFAFASRSGGLDFPSAAILAVAWSVAVLLHSYRKSGIVRLFELETAALFASFAVVGFALPGPIVSIIGNYGRAIAASALGVMAASSLVFRPLTEEYTREFVPRSRLETLGFARANRVLTIAWSIAALALAASFALGAMAQGSLMPTLLNWIVPLVAVLYCVRYCTGRWSDDDEETLVAVGVEAVSDLASAGPVFSVRRSPHLRVVGRQARRGGGT